LYKEEQTAAGQVWVDSPSTETLYCSIIYKQMNNLIGYLNSW